MISRVVTKARNQLAVVTITCFHPKNRSRTIQFFHNSFILVYPKDIRIINNFNN